MILASQLISITHYSPSSTVLWHESSHSSFLYDLHCEMWVMQFEASKTPGSTMTRFPLTLMVVELGKAEHLNNPDCFGGKHTGSNSPCRAPAHGVSHGTSPCAAWTSWIGLKLRLPRGAVSQQERAPDNKEQVAAWRCVWERRPASEGKGDRVTTLPLRGREHFSIENAHWSKGATKSEGPQTESFTGTLHTWCGNWCVSPRPDIQAHSTGFLVKGWGEGKRKIRHMAMGSG